MNKPIKILLLSIPVFIITEILFGFLAGIGLVGRSEHLLTIEIGISVVVTWIFVTFRENRKQKPSLD